MKRQRKYRSCKRTCSIVESILNILHCIFLLSRAIVLKRWPAKIGLAPFIGFQADSNTLQWGCSQEKLLLERPGMSIPGCIFSVLVEYRMCSRHVQPSSLEYQAHSSWSIPFSSVLHVYLFYLVQLFMKRG